MRHAAIRTYQSGGDIEPYDELGRPTAPPSPGGAGQATPAAPPPDQPPPMAFDPNQLVKPVDVAPSADPNRDMKIWEEREYRRFEDPETAMTFSHRGENPRTHMPDRGEYSLQAHPEFPQYERAVDIWNKYQLPKNAGQLTKAQERTMATDINRMQVRMRKEQSEKYKEAHAQELRDIQKIDITPLPYGQEEKLDEGIRTALAGYDTEKFKANFSTAEARNEALEMRAGSPYETMKKRPAELNNVIRNLIYSNRDKLGVEDAIKVVMQMGTPVKEGEDALNGLTGRAATRFELKGKDANGNRMVVLNDGRVLRMNSGTYKELSKMRSAGYDNIKAYKTKLEEERKPGMVGRALEWGGKQLGIE